MLHHDVLDGLGERCRVRARLHQRAAHVEGAGALPLMRGVAIPLQQRVPHVEDPDFVSMQHCLGGAGRMLRHAAGAHALHVQQPRPRRRLLVRRADASAAFAVHERAAAKGVAEGGRLVRLHDAVQHGAAVERGIQLVGHDRRRTLIVRR